MNTLPARIDPDEAEIGRPAATARRLVEASVSENTHRAYAGALRRLDAWLDGRELHDVTLAAYLAELHDAGRVSSSASMAVAAACFHEKLAGRPGCSPGTGGLPASAAGARRGRSGCRTWRPCSPPAIGRGGADVASSPRRSPSSEGENVNAYGRIGRGLQWGFRLSTGPQLREQPARQPGRRHLRRAPPENGFDLPAADRIDLLGRSPHVLFRVVSFGSMESCQIVDDLFGSRTTFFVVELGGQRRPNHGVDTPAFRPTNQPMNRHVAVTLVRLALAPLPYVPLDVLFGNPLALREFFPGDSQVVNGHECPEAANGLRLLLKHERYSTVPRLTRELHPYERTIHVPLSLDG